MWHKAGMADRPAPDPNAVRDALAQELYETKRFADQLAIDRQNLSDAVDTMREREREEAQTAVAPLLEAARRERERALAARDAMAAERDAAVADRDRARAAAHDAAAMLDRVTSSTAWRVTGPARRLFQALRGG